MKTLVFEAMIEKTPTQGGWHYIRLPDNIRAALRDASGKNGNVPIIATVGKTSFPTTTMSMGQQRWFFAVKAEVRKLENISVGDKVTVSLTPDAPRLR